MISRRFLLAALWCGASIVFQSACSAAVSVTSTSFTGIVDNNGNGFAQQVTLNWVDANSGGTSIPVGENVNYRQTGTLNWTLINFISQHTATPGSNPESWTIISNQLHGQYVLQIVLFDLTNPSSPVLISVDDSTNDPNLSARDFETPTQDNTPVPVITSPLTATGTTFSPFTYQITATNNPILFGAEITGSTQLPQGLSINTATGVISGTPTVFGQFSIILAASNSGQTNTAVLSLNIHYPAHGGVGLPFYFYFFPEDSLAVSGTITATTLPGGLSIAPLTQAYAEGLVGKPVASAIFGLPTTAGTTSVTITGVFNSSTQLGTIDITIDPAAAVAADHRHYDFPRSRAHRHGYDLHRRFAVVAERRGSRLYFLSGQYRSSERRAVSHDIRQRLGDAAIRHPRQLYRVCGGLRRPQCGHVQPEFHGGGAGPAQHRQRDCQRHDHQPQ